jgi:hypothetical protein
MKIMKILKLRNPKFEAWERFLEEQVGAAALTVRVIIFDPLNGKDNQER